MEKHFATYEQSLALKELGFDEPCLANYNNLTDKTRFIFGKTNEGCITANKVPGTDNIVISNERILAPLKSQVFEFFRGYRLTVVIEDYLDDYEVKIVEWTLSDDRITHEFPNRFDSWGDAESASIDKLIELVKKK